MNATTFARLCFFWICVTISIVAVVYTYSASSLVSVVVAVLGAVNVLGLLAAAVTVGLRAREWEITRDQAEYEKRFGR